MTIDTVTDGGTVKARMSRRQAQAWKLLTDMVTSEILYGGAAGGGKSGLICLWLMLNCFAYPGTRWALGRNRLTDLTKSTLEVFWEVLEASGVPRGAFTWNAHKSELTCNQSGSTICLIELSYYPSDPDWNRLGSRGYTGAAIDEAQEIQWKAIEVLKARLGRCRNEHYNLMPKLLLCANPDKGWLYREFYIPWTRNALAAGRAFVQARAADNIFLPAFYLAQLDRIEDESTRQRLRDGSWEYINDPRQLITPEMYSQALVTPAEIFGQPRMGVDVAGGDYSSDGNAIIKFHGNVVHPVQRVSFTDGAGMRDEQMASYVIAQAEASTAPVMARDIRVDASGIGAALWSVLRARGWETFPYRGNDPPIVRRDLGPAKFRNLRAQSAWALREMFRLGKIHISQVDYGLEQSLQSYRFDTDGKEIALEDKRETRKRLGRSPDEGDALIMAAWDGFRRERTTTTAARSGGYTGGTRPRGEL